MVTVLKPDIAKGRGLTITMECFKTVTRALIDHAAPKI